MSRDHKHFRAFIAIPLPEETKAFLCAFQKELQKEGIKGSWPKPAAMHLTLKFLGNIEYRQIEPIKSCMINAVKEIPRHVLYASGLGVFPSVKNTKVFWTGTRGRTEELGKLAVYLENALFTDMGLQKDKKRFSPHLTLARVKKAVAPKRVVGLISEYKDMRSDDFMVKQIVLYESELTSSGAVHKTVFSVQL